MDKLVFREVKKPKTERKYGGHTINISDEVHERAVEISEKSGLRLRDVIDMLMAYALDNVEWDGNEKI